MAGEGVTLRSGGGRANNHQHAQPLNPRRYFWLVVGYYLCAVYIQQSAGKSDTFPSGDFSSDFQLGTIGFNKQPAELLPGELSGTSHQDLHQSTEGGGHESSEGEHGIKVIKVDFEEVETPFIIALWIFCASLAKIGKFDFPVFSAFYGTRFASKCSLVCFTLHICTCN